MPISGISRPIEPGSPPGPPLPRGETSGIPPAASKISVSTSKKIGAALTVSFLLLAAVGVVSLRSARRTAEAARWVERTQDIESDLSDLAAAISGAESATRGFLLTRDPRYVAPYGGSPALVHAQLRILRRKIAGDAAQQRRLDVLEPLVLAKLEWLARIRNVDREQGTSAAVALLSTGKGRETMTSIRREVRAMVREEERQMESRNEDQERSAAQTERFILLTVILGFAFVSLAAVVIRRDLLGRRRAENALRSLSMVDELTGLYNRRGFFLHAEERVKLADRMATPQVLYFADLDDLKTINDTLGHPAGDEALAAAASILRETFRRTDIVARLGGDEFVALAFDDAGQAAGRTAQALRERIDRWNAEPGRAFHLAMSVGLTRLERNARLEDLVAAADRAMYASKQRARSPNAEGPAEP